MECHLTLKQKYCFYEKVFFFGYVLILLMKGESCLLEVIHVTCIPWVNKDTLSWIPVWPDLWSDLWRLRHHRPCHDATSHNQRQCPLPTRTMIKKYVKMHFLWKYSSHSLFYVECNCSTTPLWTLSDMSYAIWRSFYPGGRLVKYLLNVIDGQSRTFPIAESFASIVSEFNGNFRG